MSASDAPLVLELRPMPEPVSVWWQLAGWPKCLFLDSALHLGELGRYSFVTADPFAWCEIPAGAAAFPAAVDPLAEVARWLGDYPTATLPGLPPFQGGAAGLLGFELAHYFERLPRARHDEFATPVVALGCYDFVVAFDHVEHRAWIISQGFPETEPAARQRRAAARMAEVQAQLSAPPPTNLSRRTATGAPFSLAPQHPVAGVAGLTSNFSRDEYLAAVARVIEYIRAGDVFQVNLAQRLLLPAQDDPLQLYLRLRQCNGAPFAAYFDLGDVQLLSASPERFLQVRQGHVETRPIKGTRPRIFRPEADLFAAQELRESEKDRAENVMIVDLLRNDLSRVCRPESVRVTQLCRLETYPFVQHLVSAVCGELAPGRTALDLWRGAFPGGSVTGAPKIRALEIIAELEPTARGPYCGALGYFGFDGTCDSNLLIRTITTAGGYHLAPVGGGITSQSSPAQEYAETWHKAEGLLRAMLV